MTAPIANAACGLLDLDTEISKNSQPLMSNQASVSGYFYSELQFHGTESCLKG
jgi:hypothetical protein